jgi:hypothetical protein
VIPKSLLSSAAMMVGTLWLAAVPASASAQTRACDRTCMETVGERVLTSITRHDAGMLPFSPEYKATQNNVPQAASMMNIWRTISGVKDKYFAIDTHSRQMFIVATVTEGSVDSMLYGRLALDDQARISEVELYIDRARGDAGFQYGLRHGKMAFPDPSWLKPIPAGQRATREEMLGVGKSIFDRDITSPPLAEDCVMMENGEISNEDPEVLKYLLPSDVAASQVKKDAAGRALVPCAAPPERPTDKSARIDIVDEERGIVIAAAMFNGIDQPYLVENPTTSAFVPSDIMDPYLGVLKAQAATGKFNQPRVKGWPVTASVIEMYRYYGGKIHSMHLLFNMEPPGSITPWVNVTK